MQSPISHSGYLNFSPSLMGSDPLAYVDDSCNLLVCDVCRLFVASTFCHRRYNILRDCSSLFPVLLFNVDTKVTRSGMWWFFSIFNTWLSHALSLRNRCLQETIDAVMYELFRLSQLLAIQREVTRLHMSMIPATFSKARTQTRSPDCVTWWSPLCFFLSETS
jgi:hypothetical protein